MFPDDSIFVDLQKDVSNYKKLSSPAAEYTPDELAAVTAHIAAMRSKLVTIQ
jgi:hypothetical protein